MNSKISIRCSNGHLPAAICLAAQYVAEDLLRAEGFTEVQYVDMPLPQIASAVASGAIDVSAETVTDLIMESNRAGRS